MAAQEAPGVVDAAPVAWVVALNFGRIGSTGLGDALNAKGPCEDPSVVVVAPETPNGFFIPVAADACPTPFL